MGSEIKDKSVVQRMHLETIFGEASNFSAKITAFTATGIDDNMNRTEKSIPLIPSIDRHNKAINGATTIRMVKPVQNVRCDSRADFEICTLAICAPNMVNTTGEYA